MAFVTGIFPESDPKAIEQALSSQNIDMTKVKVVTKAAPSQETEASLIDFISVAQSQDAGDFSDGMTHGTGMMSDYGGTTVPGLGSRGPSLNSLAGGPRSTTNYLSGIGIPTDQIDNYNDAVEAGRCVVVHEVEGDASATADKLRAAGLRAVRTY